MKCPNCQTENPDTATFCNDCGTKLGAPQGQTPPSAKKKRGKGKMVIVAVGAIIVLCIVVAIIASLGNGGDEGTTPTAARVGEIQQTEPTANEPVLTEPQIVATSPAATELPTETPQPPATDSPSPTDTTAPTNTPLPPTATSNPDLLLPGTYVVGTDIQPGIYKGEAGLGLFDSCYWARLKDLSGSLDALIANDNSIGQFYVEVVDGDFALETACELVLLREIPAPPAEFPQTIAPGTYVVGADIQPGIYKGQAGTDLGDSCYWGRLKDVSGSLDALKANDNSIGQFYVEAVDGDFALKTACELVLLREMPAPPTEFPQTIAPGTFLVGVDIQPGTYRGQAGTDFMDSCYWGRLSNVRGEFDGLIANDNATGQYYVEVQPGDFALETACELERTGD